MWCGLAMAPQFGQTCEPTGVRKSCERRILRREREVFFFGVGISLSSVFPLLKKIERAKSNGQF